MTENINGMTAGMRKRLDYLEKRRVLGKITDKEKLEWNKLMRVD